MTSQQLKPKSDKDVKILNLRTHLDSTKTELDEARLQWKSYQKQFYELKTEHEKNRDALVKALDTIRYLIVEQ